ncbi:MAG: amidohydrolase family protein, partial [bacterium]
VAASMVCTSETCPDLAELSRAAVGWPDRFRVAGLPLGETPEERLDGVRAQLDAGFCGIRIGEGLIEAEPALLDAIGAAGAAVVAVGANGLARVTMQLAAFLNRHAGGVVVAPHFASGAPPDLLDRLPGLDRLYRHERFHVVFSRHGMFPREPLLAWARSVLARTGWERVLWGSEYPVALYRDETYASTALWIDGTGLDPTPAQRRAYLADNAARVWFGPRARAARPLDPRWCRMELKTPAPVWLFPHGALDVPEEANRRILEAFLAAGGDRAGSYRAFVTRLLAAVDPRKFPPV